MMAAINRKKKMSKNVTIETVATALIVEVKGENLDKLAKLRSLKDQQSALKSQAEKAQKELMAELGIEKVQFAREIELKNGNGLKVGSFKTGWKNPPIDPKGCWVNRLTIQKA